MYSQLKSDQSSNGSEKPWSMDLITQRPRPKRRSSILGKGRSSLRLSVAGIIPPVVEKSPGKNVADKSRVTTTVAARKPIADDVLRHFARTSGINHLNPFAGQQLKEEESCGIGSGQSLLDENDPEAITSCSAPSSSSEGSARKEDPDVTGVFFMDDVESVKKRQQLEAASSHGGGRVAEKWGGGGETSSHHHHLVPCNLMTRSPFAKEPLKDQALRLNRGDRAGVVSRTRGMTSSSSKRRTTLGAAVSVEKPTRDYSATRQPDTSPVAPVLSGNYDRYPLKSSASSSLSLNSYLSSSLRNEPENVDCAPSLRKSMSTTDLTSSSNCTVASSRDARRTASEMHFEEMCKTRCERVVHTSEGLGDLFVSKKDNRTSNIRSSDLALDQMEGRTLDRQNKRPTSVRSSDLALDQMDGRTLDRQNKRPTSVRSSDLALDQMDGRTLDRQNKRPTSVRSSDLALDQMEGRTLDRQNKRPTSVRSSELAALDPVEARTHIRANTNQSGTKTYNNYTTDNSSSSRSRGRYSVALYSSDSNNTIEDRTRKSRPSIMSDLIINQKNKYGGSDVDEMFSSKKENTVVPSRSKRDVDEISVDASNRSKYIDDLLKRIDLSVKANKYTDDETPVTNNIDASSSKIVNDKFTKNAGDVEKSKFLDDVVVKNGVDISERSSKFVNDNVVVKNRDVMNERPSKVMNDDGCNLKSMNEEDKQNNEKEVCNKFDLTLNDVDDDDDDNDKTFIENESVCNETLVVVGEQTSADKIKKLSLIEEEEEEQRLRSRMSSANESDASTELESTIRGGNISVSSHQKAAILEYLQTSHKEFNKKQAEFFEQLKRDQNEFVRRQDEKIAAFERFLTGFQQEQTAKLAALCEEDVANPTTANNSCTTDDEVFHTAQKKPFSGGVESKDSNAIYSSLKSDFKCLKTPNARSNKKAPNLNKTILTPHSMSVCVQEQVSMLFDALD